MTEAEIAVIIERLDNLGKNQAALKAEFDKSQEKAEKWRLRFDEKLDQRPCVKHETLLSSVATQLAWVWGILTIIIGAIIAEWVKK